MSSTGTNEGPSSGLQGLMGDTRRTAHEYVRDTIRQAILRGQLAAGTRLVQANLASELGVSTTPVREALRDLATEGLVQLDPHHGAVVKQLTHDEIREIQDLSLILEPEAMRQLAAQVSDEALDEAEHLAAQMEAEDDVGLWADLNRRFHAALVRDLEGTRLSSILKGLRDGAAPYIGAALQIPDNQLEDANHDHRQLLEALRAGDADRAAEIAAEHVRLTIRVLERSHSSLAADEG